MAMLYIFPDTNLLMHFQRIDELDWKALTGASDIVVVLAPAVVKELGKHKDQHPIRKLRQRARNLNSWLRQLRSNEDKRLKNGVILEVATAEPLEFLTGDLDPGVNDDRIIASALAYASRKRSVAVATDDTILLHKLDACGLRAIEIPETMRLPDEPDDLEVEAKTLRRQLADVRARQPVLDLVLNPFDERCGRVMVGRPTLDSVTTPAEMMRVHLPLAMRAERARSPLGSLSGIGAVVGLSDPDVQRYNERLAKFHRQYAAYYVEVQAVAERRRHYLPLTLRLKNTGNASATHIKIVVRFPEGFKPVEEKPDFRRPAAPTPPELPGPFGITSPSYFNSDLMGHRNIGPHYDVPMMIDRFAADVNSGLRRVQWSRDRLLHGPPEDLDTIHCMFSESLVGTTIDIEVEIHAEELPNPECFQLNLTMVEQEDSVD